MRVLTHGTHQSNVAKVLDALTNHRAPASTNVLREITGMSVSTIMRALDDPIARANGVIKAGKNGRGSQLYAIAATRMSTHTTTEAERHARAQQIMRALVNKRGGKS